MEDNTEEIKREIIEMDIIYEDKDDLKEIYENEEFITLITENLLLGIKNAIKNNKDIVHVCNIKNQHLKVTLKKEEWVKSLNHIIKYYESIDDFEECIIIKSLIQKI